MGEVHTLILPLKLLNRLRAHKVLNLLPEERLPVERFPVPSEGALARAPCRIVARAPGFVAENSVREGELLEFDVGGVALGYGDFVGVGREGEVSVGGADFGGGRGAWDGEDGVGVYVGWRGGEFGGVASGGFAFRVGHCCDIYLGELGGVEGVGGVGGVGGGSLEKEDLGGQLRLW